MLIKVLIAAHKKTPIIQDEIFTPIHVGRSLAEDQVKKELQNYIGDDNGNNISLNNVQYAELTALYWAWKNISEDTKYIGLMHYGRFFNFSSIPYEHPENVFNVIDKNIISKYGLNKATVGKLCEQYDLIIPEKWEMRKEHIEYEHNRYSHNDILAREKLSKAKDVLTMYEHYSLCHVKEDMDLAIDIISAEYPDMIESMKNSLNNTTARFTNMFVMKKELFDDYCNFLFNILFKMQEKKNYFNNDIYQKGSFHSRVFGFLSERLFSIYLDYIIEKENIKYLEKQIVFADYTPKVTQISDEIISIVMSCDDNYAPYLSVAIYSIIKNKNNNDKLEFYILNGGIKASNIKKIESFVIKLGCVIDFIDINIEKFLENCPLPESSKHITLPTYFRFSVARLLPQKIDKVLYLDIDIIVKTSLSELFFQDINAYYAIAVEDTFEYTNEIARNLEINNKYVNAGIMLINLKKWRNENIEDLFFENTLKIYHKIVFVDQDVINYTLDGKIKYIPLSWNLQQTAYHMSKNNLNMSEVNDAKANPHIVHYSGHIKPWDTIYHSWHPLTDDYYIYWKHTPYRYLYYKYLFFKKLFTIKERFFGWRFEYYYLHQEKLRGMFNDRFYLNQYSDVLESDIEPLLHYCKYGWKEGKNPSPLFNTHSYLSNNPDVKISRINPFYHYLAYGLKERRKI